MLCHKVPFETCLFFAVKSHLRPATLAFVSSKIFIQISFFNGDRRLAAAYMGK